MTITTVDVPKDVSKELPQGSPRNEAARLRALQRYQVLDTAPERSLDDLTSLAAHICGTPIALITLVDGDRQWFKSKVGWDLPETSREIGFSAQAILHPERVLVVPDARTDERFANSPLVTDAPYICFYAGTPLITPDGFAIGTLCTLDYVPRSLNPGQLEALRVLGRQVVMQLELHANVARLERNIKRRKRVERALHDRNQRFHQTLRELQQTQTQLIQTEKMSSLGQMVAGIAHEINNPVSFVYGNLTYITRYIHDVFSLLQLYRKHYPHPVPEIQQKVEAIDLDFLAIDLPKILASMKLGADRIRQIVLTLRNFSRLDEADKKPVDIHQGIDSTLLILQHRLKPNPAHPVIEIIKEYGNVPLIECYAGQLNQVFMNILSNAIDALEQSAADFAADRLPQITIRTELATCKTANQPERAVILISDNGIGIPLSVREQIFDPFFTTKPVGKGTGLGLSICYQIIVKRHGGSLQCLSQPGQGTTFRIELPIHPQPTALADA